MRVEGAVRLDPRDLLPLALDPLAYGEVLGRAIFAGAVRDAFVAARGAGGLRVLLCVEAPDLRPLRWERLCAPRGGRWAPLAFDQQAPLSLYLPACRSAPLPPIGRRDLRALVVVASPARPQGSFRLDPFDAAAAAPWPAGPCGDIPCERAGPPGGGGGRRAADPGCPLRTADRRPLHPAAPRLPRALRPASGETVLYLCYERRRRRSRSPPRACCVAWRVWAGCTPCPGWRSWPPAKAPAGGGGRRRPGGPGPAPGARAGDAGGGSDDRGSGPGRWRSSWPALLHAAARATAFPTWPWPRPSAGSPGGPTRRSPVLFSRLGGRPLFDTRRRPTGPLARAEVGDGLDRLEALLPDGRPCCWRSCEPATALTVLRRILADGSRRPSPPWRSRRGRTPCGGGRAQAWAALGAALRGPGPGPGPAGLRRRCPFRGLEPFRPEDRAFFFGREALVRAARWNAWTAHPFLAVLGPSGSGKSSLVLAGLLPALRAGGAGAALVARCVRVLRPRRSWRGAGRCAPRRRAELDRRRQRALAWWWSTSSRRLFTLCRDDAERRAFLDRAAGRTGRRRVVLTMRADFWGECAPYPALREAMQAHQELIAPWTRSSCARPWSSRRRRPSGGLRFEADLAGTILDDVRGEPGAMPLLQHALLELWKRRSGRWLRAGDTAPRGACSRPSPARRTTSTTQLVAGRPARCGTSSCA